MKFSGRQLVHLAAVIEAGSFSLAAQKLGVTQPALTKSIKQLEARVGATLIRRGTTGAEPTHLGHILAVHGLSIIASERRAAKDVEDWAHARKGQLFIGAPPAISAYLMPPIIARFLSNRPDVFLRLLVSPLDTLPLKLASNFVDLYVGIRRMDENPEGVTAHPIYDDELTIFLREGHPLLSRGDVSISSVAKYSWVVLPPDMFFRRMSDAALLEAGLPAMHIALETDSFDTQLNVVRNTDLLCILPRKMLRRQEGLVAFTDGNRHISGRHFTVAMFHRSSEETSSLAQAFIAELKTFLPPFVEAES